MCVTKERASQFLPFDRRLVIRSQRPPSRVDSRDRSNGGAPFLARIGNYRDKSAPPGPAEPAKGYPARWNLRAVVRLKTPAGYRQRGRDPPRPGAAPALLASPAPTRSMLSCPAPGRQIYLQREACSRTAALARLSRPDKEVCRPPGLTRLEWPGRGPSSPTGRPHLTEPS